MASLPWLVEAIGRRLGHRPGHDTNSMSCSTSSFARRCGSGILEKPNKYGHISDWDTLQVTDMNSLFQDASSFNGDLSR